MTKIRGFSLIEVLISFIILTVLAVGAYTVWQKPVKDESPPAPTATPTATIVTEVPTPTSAPTQTLKETATLSPNPTAGWKTYKNKQFNYLLKYPQTARVTKSDNPFNSFELYFGEPGTLAGAYADLRVEVANNPEGLSRRYFLANRLSESPEIAIPHFHIAEKKLGGIDALRIVLDGGWWQGSGPHTVHVIPRGAKMYLLWSELYSGGRGNSKTFQLHKGPNYTPINQILSTFQFTD